MTKILALATYGDFLATFELSNLSIWKELGCEVHCVSNFSDKEYNRKTDRLDKLGVIRHEIHFTRSPLSPENRAAYRTLVELMRREQFDVVDCHNAVIGAFARLAAHKAGVPKVIYTPHSFFFYKGCPKKNELIFKPVETFLARYTDVLIAINKEDYEAAKSMPVRGHALYVPGVGVDTEEIAALPQEREEYRKELGIPSSAKLLVSVGELILRKDHETAIRAFADARLSNAYYVICGIGALKEHLEGLIESLGLTGRVRLLGYRNDVKRLMRASDVFVFPSLQEGLPVALMEAMAAGLPCLATLIRGNVDLIDGSGGILFEPRDTKALTSGMVALDGDDRLRRSLGERNQDVIRAFDIRNVEKIMREEYRSVLDGCREDNAI